MKLTKPVTINSDRLSMDGKNCKGKSGEGIIIADEDDSVYVTGNGFYGQWPIEETSIKADREAELRLKAMPPRPKPDGMTMPYRTPSVDEALKAYDWVQEFVKNKQPVSLDNAEADVIAIEEFVKAAKGA